MSKSKFKGLLSQSGHLDSIWRHLLRDETMTHAMCPAGVFLLRPKIFILNHSFVL